MNYFVFYNVYRNYCVFIEKHVYTKTLVRKLRFVSGTGMVWKTIQCYGNIGKWDHQWCWSVHLTYRCFHGDMSIRNMISSQMSTMVKIWGPQTLTKTVLWESRCFSLVSTLISQVSDTLRQGHRWACNSVTQQPIKTKLNWCKHTFQ